MGKDLAEHKRVQQQGDRQRRQDEPQQGPVHPALKKLRAEADARGATLETDGEGGIPAEVTLEVFRKFGYQCPKCGGRKDLGLHHKGRHLEHVRAALEDRQKNDPAGLVVMCAACHQKIHDEDRAGGPIDPNTGEQQAEKHQR